MAQSSINLTTLDFDSIKNNLKTYLKSQSIFRDYDFEGSNISVLLDVLAYNTNINAFYMNMLSNEMFLDSAIMKDSVVSHAKELNYVPRSFRSAQATVNITIRDTQSIAGAVVIPRGTSFTGTAGNKNFTFVTADNVLALNPADDNDQNTYIASNVKIYEGDLNYDSYITNSSAAERFIVTNKTVDTNSIRVTVIEDNGENTYTYLKRDNLFGLDSTSLVFFLQAAENDTYEILFGDGVIGRKPKDNSVVLIEYRACNGELPNGIRNFRADDDIGSGVVTDVSVSVDAETKEVLAAQGGSIAESIESIKFNAPRAFATQERVITSDDYKTLLKANFSEINDVAAYGGEFEDPPQFGKVFVAVDLKTADALPPSRKVEYYNFIKPRSALAIDPVFVEPQYTYIKVDSLVKYDITQTSLNIDDIKLLASSAIQNYNLTNINGFEKTFRYSNLVSAIDAAQSSIISNDTDTYAIKSFVADQFSRNFTISFGFPLRNDIPGTLNNHNSNKIKTVFSSPFIFDGKECIIEDDGAIYNPETKEWTGFLNIVAGNDDSHEIIRPTGTVNFTTGKVIIENFRVQKIVQENYLNIYARTKGKDITPINRTILSIRDVDVNVKVEQVRL